MELVKHIAIIGHGFVGSAVRYGFTGDRVVLYIIDPKQYTSVSDLKDVKLDAAFVCVPTPFGEHGAVDSSIVKSVVNELLTFDCKLVVIKSTATPDILNELAKDKRVVYNPEFLTEGNALRDFVAPQMHIFGGNDIQCAMLETLYVDYSNCAIAPCYYMTVAEASFVKYGINSFLATKVMWFNQYKELVDAHNADFKKVTEAIGRDRRVGLSHLSVPGSDNRLGFGGACFPKDTTALMAFDVNNFLTILDTVIKENNIVRSQYDLNKREQEQNVIYPFKG
jgi:UDPglucose 6-dehydrogenase